MSSFIEVKARMNKPDLWCSPGAVEPEVNHLEAGEVVVVEEVDQAWHLHVGCHRCRSIR